MIWSDIKEGISGLILLMKHYTQWYSNATSPFSKVEEILENAKRKK